MDLRLLAVPMCASRAYVTSESDFRVYADLFRAAREYGYPVFGNWVMFEDLKGKLASPPNERFLCIEKFGSIYDLQVSFPRGLVDLFHPVDGKYPIDAIITSRAVLAGWMKRTFWHRMHGKPILPVFIIEPHVETSSKDVGEGSHNVITDQELMLRSVGYAQSHTFFATERQKNGALKEASRWLSHTLVDTIDKNSSVTPLIIWCDEMDEVKASTPKKEKFTVGFFGRLNGNKNWQFVLETLQKYFRCGKPVDIVAVTPLAGALSGLGDFPEVMRFVDLPRRDYLKMVAGCHVALNASTEEGFSLGLMEQMYGGLVVMLPRRPWVKALLKECYETYPWLYSGEAEAWTKLEQIRLNYDEAQKSMEPVRAMIRSNYDAETIAAQTFSKIEEVCKENATSFTMSEEVVELVRQAARDCGQMFKFSQLCDTVRQLARQPGIVFDRSVPLAVFPGKLQVLWTLRKFGYKDSLDSSDPLLVRPEKPPEIEVLAATERKL